MCKYVGLNTMNEEWKMNDTELLQGISNIMDKKFEPLQDDILYLKREMSGVKEKVMDIELTVTDVVEKLTCVEQKIADVVRHVSVIEMTLENETNKNIMRIAEGHLDLTRKLNTAIHIASDVQARQEIQDIYINIHESEIRKIANAS